MSVVAHDFTAGAPARFGWHSPEPLRAAPSVTFVRPDGESFVVQLLSAADIAVTAVADDRRTLTASGNLPDPVDGGDVWIIFDDQRAPGFGRIASGTPGATTIKLTEPIPHDVEASDITLQHATWWCAMTAAGPLAKSGVGTWSISADVYAPTGANADADYSGAYRALKRFDTGLTEHLLTSVRPDLLAQQRRHAGLRGVIDQQLQRIKERVRAGIHPKTLEIVEAPGDFIGVHIDMVTAFFLKDSTEIEQAHEHIDRRFADLLKTLVVDEDGDGAVDTPVRRYRDARGVNTHKRRFFTHPTNGRSY